MQETGRILKEFAKLNGLRTPNYRPDLLDAIPTHHDKGGSNEGEDSEDGGDAKNPPITEDEYVATFQPQFSTQKGPIIQSPTR